jgi:hypothetical protein
MVISQLINILTDIYNNFGDLNINIYYDPRQSESLVKDPNGINIDDAKTLQIDGESVNIMNMYSWISEYNGCRGEVYYNPDTNECLETCKGLPGKEFADKIDTTYTTQPCKDSCGTNYHDFGSNICFTTCGDGDINKLYNIDKTI